jgi:hypothetical protein
VGGPGRSLDAVGNYLRPHSTNGGLPPVAAGERSATTSSPTRLLPPQPMLGLARSGLLRRSGAPRVAAHVHRALVRFTLIAYTAWR